MSNRDVAYTQTYLVEMRQELERQLAEVQGKIANLDTVLGMLGGSPAPEPDRPAVTPPTTSFQPTAMTPVAMIPVRRATAQPIPGSQATQTPSRDTIIAYRTPPFSFLNGYPLSVSSFVATGGVRGNLTQPVNRAYQVIAAIMMIANPDGSFVYADLYHYGAERSMWVGKTSLYNPLHRLKSEGIVVHVGNGVWVISHPEFYKLIDGSESKGLQRDPTYRPHSPASARKHRVMERVRVSAGDTRRVVDETGALIPTIKDTLLRILPAKTKGAVINMRTLQEDMMAARGRRSSIFVLEQSLRLLQKTNPELGLEYRTTESGGVWSRKADVAPETETN